MREIGFNTKNLNLDLILKITKYKSADGEEYFLEIVNKDDVLFGLLRLRMFEPEENLLRSKVAQKLIASKSTSSDFSGEKKELMIKSFGGHGVTYYDEIKIIPNLFKSLIIDSKKNKKQAIIRELHVYGQAINLGEKSELSVQHTGIGKWLISEAEKIVRKNKIKKLKIISGVGVREYYRKLGYGLDREKIYVMKKL